MDCSTLICGRIQQVVSIYTALEKSVRFSMPYNCLKEATESDGQLLPVSVTTTANVKVWALKGVDGLVRVVVPNKDEAQSGSVAIRISGFASASASQLLAPSLGSKTGVTIAGQTYDGSLDGTLQGPITVQSLKAVNGVFTIIVPSASAALVTLAP